MLSAHLMILFFWHFSAWNELWWWKNWFCRVSKSPLYAFPAAPCPWWDFITKMLETCPDGLKLCFQFLATATLFLYSATFTYTYTPLYLLLY
jgi:hypothetical protein